MKTNPFFCKTCPFNGGKGIDLPEERKQFLLGKIIRFESTHICHTTGIHHCRGGRQIQAQILAAMGHIQQATPEALQKYLDKAKIITWIRVRQRGARPKPKRVKQSSID